MKILVLSDSHGQIDAARAVLEKLQERVDMVFHLGDCDSDAALLQKFFPQLSFHVVRGNNDYGGGAPSNKLVRACGKTFLLTHGHKERVSWGYDTIAYWAEEQGADVVVFGHTHSPLCDDKGRVFLFNPGSISRPRDSRVSTFGILTVSEGRTEGAIMEYREDGTIHSRG